jgi:hypothetical protein
MIWQTAIAQAAPKEAKGEKEEGKDEFDKLLIKGRGVFQAA